MRDVYAFNSQWLVAAPAGVVWRAIDGLLERDDPFGWWPSIRFVGRDGPSLWLEARSVFGYRLRLRLHDLARERGHRLTFASDGDLRGQGALALRPLGAGCCAVDIEWKVSTHRRWMRLSSWLLRPVFTLAHHVLMRQGEKSFRRWIADQQRT